MRGGPGDGRHGPRRSAFRKLGLLALGAAAKIALAFAMLGIFLAVRLLATP